MENGDSLALLHISIIVMLYDFKFILQSRIKKIMQADEDVGKIAMAVPLLVCMYIHLSINFSYFLFTCFSDMSLVLTNVFVLCCCIHVCSMLMCLRSLTQLKLLNCFCKIYATRLMMLP